MSTEKCNWFRIIKEAETLRVPDIHFRIYIYHGGKIFYASRDLDEALIFIDLTFHSIYVFNTYTYLCYIYIYIPTKYIKWENGISLSKFWFYLVS